LPATPPSSHQLYNDEMTNPCRHIANFSERQQDKLNDPNRPKATTTRYAASARRMGALLCGGTWRFMTVPGANAIEYHKLKRDECLYC
jgi:hypothetical protein